MFRSMAEADPGHYVRGQYDGYRRSRRHAGFADRDLRRAATRDRQLALGGRAVLHPHRQTAADQGDRGAPGVQAPAAAGVHPLHRPPASSRARSCSGSIPRPASGWSSMPTEPTDRAAGGRAGHGLRGRGWRGCDAVRGSAERRAGRRRQRTSPARTASRSHGAWSSRCWTCRGPCIRYQPGSWGPAEAQRLVSGFGTWRGPWSATEHVSSKG